MQVLIDLTHHEVRLLGDRCETRLNWASAINLGSLLIEKGHEAEPPAQPGRVLSTKESR
jgi:hypothetical protein